MTAFSLFFILVKQFASLFGFGYLVTAEALSGASENYSEEITDTAEDSLEEAGSLALIVILFGGVGVLGDVGGGELFSLSLATYLTGLR